MALLYTKEPPPPPPPLATLPPAPPTTTLMTSPAVTGKLACTWAPLPPGTAKLPPPPSAPSALTVTSLTPAGTVNVSVSTVEKVQVTLVVPVQDGAAPAGVTPADSRPTDATTEPRATADPMTVRRRTREATEPRHLSPLVASTSTDYCTEGAARQRALGAVRRGLLRAGGARVARTWARSGLRDAKTRRFQWVLAWAHLGSNQVHRFAVSRRS